ncbi:hypothetical protein EW026_g6379 [Hermanssonia centrifuga]|uniref:Histone-lysine N-methyltransferase, H3 lysine-4 specific n=1 Tax=Hermanssonia centrifuga TaxID=98765 RepID=A0A4S4KB76_9APHY|nr:hypothetical protein EW026_g6379 [Hermanssonia centrifuga]
MNISPLTPNIQIRNHFSSYGTIVSFEPQINKANGATLGIVLIRFSSHEEAKRCLAKEHGLRESTGIGKRVTIVEGEELKVVFDGEGKKLQAVMKELEVRKRRKEREERKRKEEERKKEASLTASKNTPTTSTSDYGWVDSALTLPVGVIKLAFLVSSWAWSATTTTLPRPGTFSKSARQREHNIVVEELAKNGLDYVTIDGGGSQLGGAVREEDVRQFFEGFYVDKVLQDHAGCLVEEPPAKKAKKIIEPIEDDFFVPQRKKSKKTSKKKNNRRDAPTTIDELIHEVLPDDSDFDVPAVTQKRRSPTPLPVVDPQQAGVCDDDEDMFFTRLALSGLSTIPRSPSPTKGADDQVDPDSPRPFRIHVTGSARTEGYYKISHAEKSAYVAQYATRATANETAVEEEPPQPQNVTSSRSNRANARRRAQGLEEINQVQLAMALSKGETAATELVKFNQLQTRKKHLRFARSPIHDWGLYAMEKISRGEMVIEYVGEVIRAQVADKREKAYERQGIGSSYLFRIDEDLVVDATKKGNLGRLINHSCDPNCTAKIITINGEKKIVIYAKQDIELGSEITYDYHFPIEQDKIPCLCGSAKCRGYLN